MGTGFVWLRLTVQVFFRDPSVCPQMVGAGGWDGVASDSRQFRACGDDLERSRAFVFNSCDLGWMTAIFPCTQAN